MKKYPKPNTVLPKGATMLKRCVTKSMGDWSVMTYDAVVMRLGLAWYRVKGGFSETHSREDWCAALPTGCLHVGNEDWDGTYPFGYDNSFHVRYYSFDGAVVGETIKIIESAKRDATEAHVRAAASDETVKQLTAAVKKAKKRIKA